MTDGTWINQVEAFLDWAGFLLMRWWVWPATMGVLGSLALLASWVCAPVGNDVYLLGFDLFGECQSKQQLGVPCGSCGMTRSWVWAARGHLIQAARYNVAGFALYALLLGGGLLGAVRLLRRRPDWMALPWWAVGVVTVGWLLLYAASWVLRLTGSYPLP